MQRLSGLDAMFFYLETPSSHMHVTGVYVMEPGKQDTSFEALRAMVAERLPLAAPFRRKLVEVPLKLSHPFWIEDPDFDLDYHVRRAALPAPGGPRELENFVAQVVGLPLDRSRPLWEMYFVEGLEGGRVATVTKIHHAAIDGVSGAELAATWLDLEPTLAPRVIVDPWRPEPIPSDVELMAFAMTSLVGHPMRVVTMARRVFDSVLHVTARNRRPGVEPPPSPFDAPKTSLNQAITPHRAVRFSRRPLDELKAVKNHFGCTVNDVVLAVCASALRRYLIEGDELPPEPLVAMVPLSVRTESERGAHGNRVSAMLTSLATDVEDPVDRLKVIAESMRSAKEQEQLIGAETLTDWTEFTFPALIGRASRLVSSMKVFDKVRPAFNVTISNVPGPPFPLFMAGSRIGAFYPLGPVAEGVGLNITVMSYCGTVQFGLNACRESVPRIEDLPRMLDDGLDELLALARPPKRRSARTGSSGSTGRTGRTGSAGRTGSSGRTGSAGRFAGETPAA
jgi:diacylglycerol O-acyltransferase